MRTAAPQTATGQSGAGGTQEASATEQEYRVPVVGPSAASQDPSAWEVGGAAAGAGLFVLGAWASRRRKRADEEEGASARIVSTEPGSWGGGAGAGEPQSEELAGVAMWRPSREAAAGLSAVAPRVRLGRLPEGYDPETAAEAAAKEAEAAQAAVEEEEEQQPATRSAAELLVQEAGAWGAPRPEWGEL